MKIKFSDILMLPYGIGQKVAFKKNFGPILQELDINKINEHKFVKKLQPIYNSIKKVSEYSNKNNKDLIGFVGAPWTLLVYMLNKQSPKKNINKELFNNHLTFNILKLID